MITRSLLVACAATASLAVAGCGADDTPTSSSGTRGVDAKTKKAMLNYAQCMREHGVDMPDPTFDGGGVRMAQKGAVDPQKARAAESACRHFQDEVKPPPLSEEQQTEMKKKALANSRCMREHGFDMPDPTFEEGGRMTLRIDKSSGIDPGNPKFQAAQKACQKQTGLGAVTSGSKQ
jgi:hypothetical protein